jgi:FKBP-type peptidyl-prolyl cis-trans isomerase
VGNGLHVAQRVEAVSHLLHLRGTEAVISGLIGLQQRAASRDAGLPGAGIRPSVSRHVANAQILISSPWSSTMAGMAHRLQPILLVALTVIGCGSNSATPADLAAPPADAMRTPSGLASKVLQVGVSNVRPSPRSTVRVHYTGWTTDGQKFDSSVDRREPAEFGLSDVIPGWTEALQLMVVGEKRRFWIPGELAYDKIPDRPGMPPNPKGMLVFDIELIAVK